MRRYDTPAEIADLILWLYSDRARFINGAAFTADGERLASA